MTDNNRAELRAKIIANLRRPPYPHNEQYGVGWFDAMTAVLSLLDAETERQERKANR